MEILEARTAAPGVIAVVLESDWLPDSSNAPLALTASDWRINGNQPVAINRQTIPHEQPRKTDLDVYQHEVKVRHRVYLDTGTVFLDGSVSDIVTPYGNARLTYDEDATHCEAIKVNQVGYHKDTTTRFANFGVWLGDGGSRSYSPLPTYEVRNVSDGSVVHSGTSQYMGHDTGGGVVSGEHVYRLSLNDVPEGGPYYVVVPGCGRSYDFGVGDAYTSQIAYTATRGLYHQRCGIALESAYTQYTRGACHTTVYDTRDQTNPEVTPDFIHVHGSEPQLPISGGYHDAGDFDRRAVHHRISELLLATYEGWPTHFVDSQYDIPESGNGIPDFLDEALWSFKHYETLQVTSGSDAGGIRAGTEGNRHPGYGLENAANDPILYGTYQVHAYSTAWVGGIFAHAARLVAPYDEARAAALRQRAENAWSWLAANDNVDACEGKYLYLSLQLYLATGNPTYHDKFKSVAQRLVVDDACGWPEQFKAGNVSAKVHVSHFASYLTPHGRATDPALVAALKSRIFHHANVDPYMGAPTGNEPYPQGYTKFGDWGASTAQGRYAEIYMWANYIETDPTLKQKYFDDVARFHDYAVGLNPLSMSFITGLGDAQPFSPLHLDSWYTKYGINDGVSAEHHGGSPKGNVPGIILFGPTDGRSGAGYQTAVTNKIYPGWDSLPRMRRWGDGWSAVNLNEFSTHETIAWNVAMYGFLYDASQGGGGGTPPPGPPPPPAQPAAPVLLE